MSAINIQPTSTNHVLPDDIYHLHHDHFNQLIETQYGIDLAELFRFQSIRYRHHLLQASLDDTLAIPEVDSIHLNEWKMFCFEVMGNMFTLATEPADR